MADTDTPGQPGDTPWQSYLRAHPRTWHQIATDVRWDGESDRILGELGMDGNAGFSHSAEALLRNPDGGLHTVNLWALYREPGTHLGPDDVIPDPPFTPA
jgi:hypothetical protein